MITCMLLMTLFIPNEMLICDCGHLFRCANVTNGELDGSSFCQWNYNGMGIEYQILAGPSFILAFTIGGLIIGALADRYNRYSLYSKTTQNEK